MIGWVDGSAGASGDMLLAALVDVGVPLEVLRTALDTLGLGLDLSATEVVRGQLRATKVEVVTPEEQQPLRTLAEVRGVLASLDRDAAQLAGRVFSRLAAAEARVHGTTPAEVTFHEVGALDAIADVVGVVVGVRELGLDALHASPLSLGTGRTGTTAHGRLPVPAPAVLELLHGVPVAAGVADGEATTPTGAALLAELVTTWGPLPPMTLGRTGLGAGTRDPDDHPNVLRLVTGTDTDGTTHTTAVQLDANVDDLDPRVWPHVLDALLAAGADDAWLTPIHMKKGRPAVTVSALAAADRVADVRGVLLRETSTIGLRQRAVGKVALRRTSTAVELDGHTIAVKLAWLDGEVVNRSVEWDDVAAAAAATGRPVAEVLAAANALAQRTDAG